MCCLTLQGSTLKHCFYKTLVISQATWQHIPETEIFSHCRKNPLSHRAYATLISIDTLNFAALWNRGDALSKILFLHIIIALKSTDILWGNTEWFLYLCCFHHAVPAFWCVSPLFYNCDIISLNSRSHYLVFETLCSNSSKCYMPCIKSYIYFHFAPTWMRPYNKFANTRENFS